MGLIALLPSVLLLVLMGLVIGSAILGIRRSAFLPRGLPAACCPACKYRVDVSRPISVCPECGRDLRVAGVLSPELIVRFRGSSSQITGGVGLVCVLLMLVAGLGTAAGAAGLNLSDTVTVIASLSAAGVVLLGGVLAGLWLVARRKRLLGASRVSPAPDTSPVQEPPRTE